MCAGGHSPRQRAVLHFEDARGDEAAAVIAGALEAGRRMAARLGRSPSCSIAMGSAAPESLGRWLTRTPLRRRARGPSEAGSPSRRRGRSYCTRPTSVAVTLGPRRSRGRCERGRRDRRGRWPGQKLRATRSWSRPWSTTGVELLIGVVDDPVFGPVLACGAGGVDAEILKDVAVRVCPLTREDASEMLHSFVAVPAPHRLPRRGTGRISPPLEEMLLRVGAMVEAHPRDRRTGPQPGASATPRARSPSTHGSGSRRCRDRRPWPSTWKLGDPE